VVAGPIGVVPVRPWIANAPDDGVCGWIIRPGHPRRPAAGRFRAVRSAPGFRPGLALFRERAARAQGALRARNSARHISLKARSGSIAWLSISSRNSGNVLFGAKYGSTIVRTTASAFSTTTSDDRHGPLIEVSESMFWLTSLELSRDQASDIAPFLDRRPRHARHRVSIAHDRRRVADDEHAGHLLKSWSLRQTRGG
jgi:hypothetical protein